MEKMPYQPHLDATVRTLPAHVAGAIDTWRTGLPALSGSLVTLGELRVTDAPALFAALTSDQVSRFISPPPASIDGFERFVAWTHGERAAGQYVCFAIVPHGSATAIGVFQVRSL